MTRRADWKGLTSEVEKGSGVSVTAAGMLADEGGAPVLLGYVFLDNGEVRRATGVEGHRDCCWCDCG